MTKYQFLAMLAEILDLPADKFHDHFSKMSIVEINSLITFVNALSVPLQKAVNGQSNDS